MKKIKEFGNKKIMIREMSAKDLKNVKGFQDYINSLIEEDAQILFDKKFSIKQERKALEDMIRKIKAHKRVFLYAEADGLIVGFVHVEAGRGRKSHIGSYGIAIREDYRGVGIGKYLTTEVIRLAKKKLKPEPKIISLTVFPDNKPAIKLYEKFGFKKVATIPDQLEYKGKLIDEIVMLKYL